MSRLAEYLRPIAVPATKWERIGAQLRKIRDDIAVHRLGPYFQSEGAGEVEKEETGRAALRGRGGSAGCLR